MLSLTNVLTDSFTRLTLTCLSHKECLRKLRWHFEIVDCAHNKWEGRFAFPGVVMSQKRELQLSRLQQYSHIDDLEARQQNIIC